MAKQPKPKKEKKPPVFTWPWIITAWLMPVVLGAGWFASYYYWKTDTLPARAETALKEVEARAQPYSVLQGRMKEVIEVSGYGKYDPKVVQIPIDDLKAKPKKEGEELTPMAIKWNEILEKVYNSGDGNIAKMRADREAFEKWRLAVERNLAYKLYNGHRYILDDYADPLKGDAGIGALAYLRRPGVLDENVKGLRPSTDEQNSEEILRAAHVKYKAGTAPFDPRLTMGQRLTIQEIIAFQRDIMVALTDTTHKQWGNLKPVVNMDIPQVDSMRDFDQKADALTRSTLEPADAANKASVRTVSEAAEAAKSKWDEVGDSIESPTLAAVSKFEAMVATYQQEILTHKRDAKAFHDLLQANKIMQTQFPIPATPHVDGRVTYVDRGAKLCHISLGSDDGVKAGMRFEIWQVSGKDTDTQKGVLEVVRTLSPYYSLCVILDHVEDTGPIREGDSIINVLWEKGKYLSVALHGKNWGAPNTRYHKYRLIELLKSLGVTVHDKVQPNTDIVIAGSGLVFDPWYRESRGKIRFEVLKEERVRIYVDPR